MQVLRGAVRAAYTVAAWLFVVGILAQVFFAGMGLFACRASWETHIGLGHLLGLLPLLMVILVLASGYPRRTKGFTALLFLNYLLMADLVIFIRRPPQVAALHPVLAVILFAFAVHVARESLALMGTSPTQPAEQET